MRKAIVGLLVWVVAMGVGVSCLVGSAHAQTPGGGQAVNEPYTPKVAQQEFDEYYAAIQNCETPSLECLVRYVMRYSAIEWIGEAAGPNNVIQQEADAGFNYGTGSGAITGLFSMIGEFYKHPPAETSVYIADLVESAGFAPPAYAQGLGFASLSPILDLWKMFRNVAYFFFIGAFIVIGFMIMFRYKIAGQTAVTAQQAIPSVIISLVLVTFSYAIAGLLVDLMYLTMFMMLGIFGDLLGGLKSVTNGEDILSMGIFGVGGMLFKAIWFGNESGGLGSNLVNESLAVMVSESNWLVKHLSLGGGVIISLVLTVAALIGVFKLFFELLKSYFSIVVAVVTSPILLMIGAIPGKNTFTPWIKGITGNLAAFPTVLLALIMFSKFTSDAANSGGFMPPFLIGSGVAGMIGPMLGFATILALPEIVKKVKESLGASDGGFAAAIAGAAWDRSRQGAPIGSKIGFGVAGGLVGTASGLGQGLLETRGQPIANRLWITGQRMGRGIGNNVNRGVEFGGRAATMVGGKTPSEFSAIETIIDASAKHFTESEALKRIAERRNIFNRPEGKGKNTYQYRKEIAEAQAAKKAWEEDRLRAGQYGTPIDKP